MADLKKSIMTLEKKEKTMKEWLKDHVVLVGAMVVAFFAVAFVLATMY